MAIPFDTLHCAKWLQSAGFNWEQAVALTESLVKAAATQSSADGARPALDLGARRTATLRKPILTFEDWQFMAAIVLLFVAVLLPE